MSQPPTAALLRLREADVVRLCGLAAAAAGLEAAARHAVLRARREGGRLAAVVAGEAECAVWAEFTDDGDLNTTRWGCTCEPGTSAPGPPACSHVAALLAAWIRDPDIFDAAAAAPPPSPTPPGPRPAGAAPPREPPQARGAGAPRPMPAPTTRGPLPLGEELARLPARELQAMALRVLGADLPEHEARLRLAEALADDVYLSAVVARLDAGAQSLLGLLNLLGGIATTADLEGIAERSGRSPAAMRDDAAVLERHGLLFRAVGPPQFAPAGDEPRRALTGWRVPREIRVALDLTLPLERLPAHGNGPPLLGASPQEHQALRPQRGSPRPLCLALALLAHAPAPLGPIARASAGEAARQPSTTSGSNRVLASIPGDLAPGRLHELARGAGLEPGATRLARRVLLLAREQAEGQPISDIASVPEAERPLVLRAGFRLWANAAVPAELADLAHSGAPVRARFDATHPAFTMAAIGEDCAAGRRFVLRLLRAAQPGTWYALDALLDLIWRLRPLFLRGRQQTYSAPMWWLERDGRQLRPGVREEWLAGEGEYLCALLAGPLYDWGALDLARDTMRQPQAFRLAPFGRFLLGHEGDAQQVDIEAALRGKWGPPALATREGALAVQPLAAAAGLLWALAHWARPTSVAGGRLIVTPSPDLACAAFDRDVKPDDLLARLRALEVPGGPRAAEALAQPLAAWRAAYGQTRIEAGWALLEARDAPALVEALAAVPDVAARCRRLGETFALVPAGDLPALQKALTRRSYHV